MPAYEFLFSNNATTTLTQSVSAAATVINVSSGDGSLFPSPSSGQAFGLTLVSATNTDTNEICYCTSRNGDELTVVRAQEGTAALAFSAGDTAANYITADTIGSFLQDADLDGYATEGWVTDQGFETTSAALLLSQRASAPFYAVTRGTTIPVPSWATRLEVWMTGGGGGGAGCNGTSLNGAINGGGGGAGATAYVMASVSSGQSVSFVIGIGGSGGFGTDSANAGGSTILTIDGNTIMTARGGGNSNWYSANGSSGAPGGIVTNSGSSAIISYFPINGGMGTDGQSSFATRDGSGGASFWGGGGRAGVGAGIPGSAWGAGGGGAYQTYGGAHTGGAGAQGIVLYRLLP